VLLGSAEAWISDHRGTVYAAPNLIYHYVRDVGYLPPEEFVEAVVEWGRLRDRK
jgi:hypothetical protein